MRHLIIPLILAAIIADVYCMWQWENISDKLYYIGEPIVYFTWVFAFWIYSKWNVSAQQKKTITLILLSWLPFCLNTIYKEIAGIGYEKHLMDLYSGFISLALVIGQIIVWWYKSKKNG